MRESISREYYVMPRPRKPSDAVRFQTGAKVRVKSGIRVPDFSDIPLGGWSGTITEVDAKPPVTFLIKWDRRTLELMHPVYRKRCESDGTTLTVSRLIDPKQSELEEEEGLLCEARDRQASFTVPLSELDDAVGN